MIGILNRGLESAIRVLFFPIRNLDPWVGLGAVSLATSFLILLAFRHLSDQEEIRRVKDKIKAHLLEMLLFRDDLRVTLAAQGRITRYNLRYLACTLKPLVVLSVPILLVLIHLDFWFGYQPLRRGEAAILKVKVAGDRRPSSLHFVLRPSAGIDVETAPLRIDHEGEVDWRLRANREGDLEVSLEVGVEKIGKDVRVEGNRLVSVSPARVRSDWRNELLNPGEAVIPASSVIERIELSYPQARVSFFGWRLHWLLAYFVLTMLFAFVLKPFLKIDF